MKYYHNAVLSAKNTLIFLKYTEKLSDELANWLGFFELILIR
jgi:hypothetical protein